MTTSGTTKVDIIINWFKSNKFTSIIIVSFIGIIGLGQVFDAYDKTFARFFGDPIYIPIDSSNIEQKELISNDTLTYSLKFKLKESSWSKENFETQIARNLCPPTGRSGDEFAQITTVSVSIPEGTKMIKDKVESGYEDKGGWGHWETDFIYSNNDMTVSRSFKHWIHDQPRQIWIKAYYKKRNINYLEEEVFFDDTNILAPNYYSIDLPRNYDSFKLIIEDSKGYKFLISPENNPFKFIKISVDEELGRFELIYNKKF